MTTENNKIIAKFMEWDILNDMTYSKATKGKWIELDKLKFYSNWDWLMEVVEKIENLPSRTLQGNYYLGNEVKIYKAINTNTHYCEINLVKESGYRIVSIQFNKESKIKSVYDACLEFIKWYNEQNKV